MKTIMEYLSHLEPFEFYTPLGKKKVYAFIYNEDVMPYFETIIILNIPDRKDFITFYRWLKTTQFYNGLIGIAIRFAIIKHNGMYYIYDTLAKKELRVPTINKRLEYKILQYLQNPTYEKIIELFNE